MSEPKTCPSCGSEDVTVDYRIAKPVQLEEGPAYVYPARCNGCGAELGETTTVSEVGKMVPVVRR